MSSSDENGYRLALYNLLAPGNHVEYIGQQRSGSMAKNRHEGHPGADIAPIREFGKEDYADRPNVVLLMAGTNNIFFNVEPENAPTLLGNVIDDVIHACPDVVVLVASLTPLRDPSKDEQRVRFNDALPAVIAAQADAGKQVERVDMGRITMDHINTVDGVHPTDEGYQLMASIWYEAIVVAGKKGWIKKPVLVPEEEPAQEISEPEPVPESESAHELEPEHAEQELQNKTSQEAIVLDRKNPAPVQLGGSFTTPTVHRIMAVLACAVLVMAAFAIRILSSGGKKSWRYSRLQ